MQRTDEETVGFPCDLCETYFHDRMAAIRCCSDANMFDDETYS